MAECDLNFSPVSSNEAGSYKLVELTPDFTTLIENALRDNLDLRLEFGKITTLLVSDQYVRFTIKGHSNDDAVLCTADKTYTMRSIVLSNTVLVATAAPDEHASDYSDGAVFIRDQINEIIELVPIVPKLHKLSALIRNRQYDEGQEDEVEEDETTVCYTTTTNTNV